MNSKNLIWFEPLLFDVIWFPSKCPTLNFTDTLSLGNNFKSFLIVIYLYENMGVFDSNIKINLQIYKNNLTNIIK